MTTLYFYEKKAYVILRNSKGVDFGDLGFGSVTLIE
jgi:hypothetical protein